MSVVTVKFESSFEYEATCLFTKPSHASLEWMSTTPYKPEMTSKMPSPIDHREEEDADDFQDEGPEKATRRRGG
jgi:hypothetical protein